MRPNHRLVGIASAGCNLLAYTAAGLGEIDAVDINRAHLSLSHLKITAIRTLPSFEHFFRFFGCGRGEGNVTAYDHYIRDRLDPDARRYWEGRTPCGSRRIGMFADGFYRHGVLSRFVGLIKLVARGSGRDIAQLVTAKDLDQQRRLFDQLIAPLFGHAFVRWIARSPASLFALGIPPRQHQELDQAATGEVVDVLRERIRRLACDHPIADNYFAWQAFARRYDTCHRRAVPPYLESDNYDKLRNGAAKIKLHARAIADYLASRPANSVHRFVLLDSQDWMNERDLCTLWIQINRTADVEDARVIFRTAGDTSPVLRLPEAVRADWDYREADSQRLLRADRSSLYGGFHLYVRRPKTESVTPYRLTG